MQFIDQSPAYSQKAMSLDRAIGSGRAVLRMSAECEALAVCFRPALEKASAFDRDINTRCVFNDLSTPEKLDLMIAELLPRFYHPELLPLTGRDTWTLRFLVDGKVSRVLQVDADGLRLSGDATATPDFELETDIMTLMAILRATIAQFHLNPAPYPDPAEIGDAAARRA